MSQEPLVPPPLALRQAQGERGADPHHPEPGAAPNPAILSVAPLTAPWPTLDPFLFCMHHSDAYPAGDARLGPAASLAGREPGSDFSGLSGWSMYHGREVPGFPAHPHSGFETVTIVRRGLVDHADSLGAAARYGRGDVQWLTAGRGIQHSEMFPLVDAAGENPLDLFQIWLALPAAARAAAPHFGMFWADRLPRLRAGDGAQVTVVAGALAGAVPLAPPPESWAARPEAEVAIWTLRLPPAARFTLPPAPAGVNRVLYVHGGEGLRVAGEELPARRAVQLAPAAPASLEAGEVEAEALLLQGRPIGEPVVQHGPFVGGSRDEIQRAFAEYRRTAFGGWRWNSPEPVFPRGEARFARFPDGRIERPSA
jgi:redox-sensitive bicupin YhaK (pirin superfamily)